MLFSSAFGSTTLVSICRKRLMASQPYTPSGKVNVCQSSGAFFTLVFCFLSFCYVLPGLAHRQFVQRCFVVFCIAQPNRWIEVNCKIVRLLFAADSFLQLCEPWVVQKVVCHRDILSLIIFFYFHWYSFTIPCLTNTGSRSTTCFRSFVEVLPALIEPSLTYSWSITLSPFDEPKRLRFVSHEVSSSGLHHDCGPSLFFNLLSEFYEVFHWKTI